MKRSQLIYGLLLIILVLINKACVDPLTPIVHSNGDDPALDLTLSCKKPGTKVDPYPNYSAGDSEYNENAVLYVDWFIFPTNPVENATVNAVLHGRVLTEKDNVTEAFLATSISMRDYVSEYGQDGTAEGYVYVVANLPDNCTHEEKSEDNLGGIKYTVNGTTIIANTFKELQDIPLFAEFNSFTLGTENVPSSATFKEQDSFVMTSDLLPFQLGPNTPSARVTADLSRVAAKISLDIDVAYAIDQTNAEMSGRDTSKVEYLKTWYPDVDDIQIYLSYYNSSSTLKATPVSYNNNTFFTYNRYAFESQVQEPETEVDNPFKYHDQQHEIPTVSGYVKPSKPAFYRVSGTPFYSYPMEWTTSDSHAPFIKIILPWTAYDEDEEVSHVHQYISHNAEAPEGQAVYHPGDTLLSVTRNKGTVADDGSVEYFYKISLPTEDLKLLANHWLKIKLEIAILGSQSDDLSTELTGRYYVVDWSDPVATASVLSEGKYLSTARDTFYIYGGNSIEIPVFSSHNISTDVTGVSFKDFSTQNPTTKTSLEDLSREASTNDNGRVSFTFTHDLMTDVENATSDNKPDVSAYTFKVKITNDVGLSKTVTIIQEPPLMIENDKNSVVNNTGGVYVNYYTYSSGGWWSQTYYVNGYTYRENDQGDWIGGVNGINTSGTNSNPNMYIVTTSVAPAGAVIADPRSQTVNNNLGSQNRNWSSPQGYDITNSSQQRRLTYYYPADNSELAKNKIAPKFRIASSYGFIQTRYYNSDFLTYNEAQKRCASYQEDGFPAGRWRIPTKAEMEYMIKLSNIEVIPSLFTPTERTYYNYSPNYYQGGYWSADGGVIYPFTDGTVGYLNATEFAEHSNYSTSNSGYAMKTNGVRCVYDDWYWGTSDRLTNRTRFTWGDKSITW